MPHVVFESGTISATTNFDERQLVPGIEPGGTRAGHPQKPALLLKDAYAEITELDLSGIDDFNVIDIGLLLSRLEDVSNGIFLPVAELGSDNLQESAIAHRIIPLNINQMFHGQGTVWAPFRVGGRVIEGGAMTVAVNLHLDYEVLLVPWIEWFVMWDFLDNIPASTYREDY